MAKSKKKKGSGLSLNFKDVKVLKTPAEGNYKVRVEEAELGKSSNDNEMISWTFEIVGGKFDGQKLWYNTNTGKESLWKLREVLEALGQDVPDGKMDLDLSELVGCECGVVVFHEVYEGKNKAKIADFLAADEVDEEDSDEEEEDDEEDKPKGKGKKSKASGKKNKEDDDEEDDEEESESIDVSSMDEDELAEVIEDKGLDVDLDDFSSIKKKRKAVADALESAGGDDEEESDETTYSEDQINDMDLEALEELNNDLELDIDDFDDLTVKKARKAVLKALKKKKLLED